MKYGIPTLIEDESIQETAKRCRDLGLDFVEINMNLPIYQVNVIDVEVFKRTAIKNGITYTIHVDENLNPFDFNDKVAKAYLDTILDTISLAKKLSVPIINMHMPKGVYFTMPNEKIYLFDKYKRVFIDKVLSFRKRVEKTIGQTNIKICIENSGEFEDFQFEGIEILLAGSCFYLTYDIGHGACNQGSMDKYYSIHENKLIHMHCHDAMKDTSGKWIDHLPLGEGTLDIECYLKLAERLNLSIVLEIKTALGLAKSTIITKQYNITDGKF